MRCWIVQEWVGAVGCRSLAGLPEYLGNWLPIRGEASQIGTPQGVPIGRRLVGRRGSVLRTRLGNGLRIFEKGIVGADGEMPVARRRSASRMAQIGLTVVDGRSGAAFVCRRPLAE